MYSIVSQILDKQHRAIRGEWKFARPQTKALLVSFRLHSPRPGNHYIGMDMVLFGSYNYIGVYVRYHTLPQYEDIEGTTTEWSCLSYHDSCYREGMEDILRQRRFDIYCVDDMFRDNWFNVVDVEEPLKDNRGDPESESLRTGLKAAQQWLNERMC